MALCNYMPGSRDASRATSSSWGIPFSQALSHLLLLLLVVALCGCVSSRHVASRIVTAPNLQAALPSKTLGTFWTNMLKDTPDPFLKHRVPVGPPAAELVFSELPPGDYNVQVHSELHDAAEGKPSLKVRFGFGLAPATNAVPERGTIFLLHGYMTSREIMYPWAFLLAKEGYRVFAIDLRGHGKSSGDTVSFGKYESADLAQVLDYCLANDLCRGPVAALGVSYGADMALHWMARDPRVRTAVAIAPYNRPGETAFRLLRELKAPIPRGTLHKGLARASSRLGIQLEEWSGEAAVLALAAPVLIVGGGRDRISPPADCTLLKNLAPEGSKLLVVPEANHDVIALWFHGLETPVREWFNQQLPFDPPQTALEVLPGNSPQAAQSEAVQ